MYPNLMHPSGYRPAFYQCMTSKNPEGRKCSLSVFSLRAEPDGTIIQLQNRCINQNIFEIMASIRDSMIDFTHFPVLELKAQVAIRFRIPCNGQHPGSLFIQSVADLGVRLTVTGQRKDINRLNPVFEGGDERGLVDYDIILVFKQDQVFKFD